MRVTARKQRWIVALGLVLVVCLSAAAYVVTFQIDVLHKVAQHLIAGALGERVAIQRVRVEIFPRPELALMGVSIDDPGRDTPLFHASEIRLGIRWFSWGEDAGAPNVVMIENAHVDLARDRHGRWNYQDLLHEGASGGAGVFLSGVSLDVVNGSLAIEDRFHRDVPVRVRADAVELRVERLALEGSTDVSFSARLSDRKTGSRLSSSGTIEHLGAFLDPAPSPDVAPHLALHTRVELARRTLVEATAWFGIDAVPVGFQGITSAQGHLHVAPGVRGYDLAISDLVVSTDVVDLNVDMSIAGVFHHEPVTVFSQWTSTPLAMRHVPQVLPSHWRVSKLYQKIARQVGRGTIQAVSATVAGSARPGLGYTLGGEFRVAEGAVTFGSKWGKAEHVGGVIHVRPDRIQFSEFHGMYGDIPVTEATGTIVLDEHGPWLTTELVGTVSPTQLFGIVQKVSPAVGDWDAGLSPSTSLDGRGDQGVMRVRFGGPLKHPKRIAFQHAEYRPEHVTLKLPWLPERLTRVRGLFVFSPHDLRVENVRGQYGKSDFRMEGTMHFAKPASSDEVTIQGRMHSHDILSLFPDSTVSERKRLSGAAHYKVAVSGTPGAPTIRGAVDLQGLGIAVPGMIEKAPPLAGHLDFNVHVDTPGHLSFKHVSLTLPSVGLAGQGHFHYGHTPSIRASFTTDPIHFAALPRGLRVLDKAVSAGTLEVSLGVRGTGRDWRSWDKSGWVALTNGTVTLGGMTTPMSRVFLRAKLHGHAADLKQLQWKMGESRVRITGAIAQWDRHPAITVTMNGSHCDLARLVPGGGRSLGRKTFETLARTVTVSGDVQCDRARYRALAFREVTGRLRMRDSLISVDDIQAKTEHGTIRGRVVAHLPVQRPVTVRTWFDARNIPLLALEHTFLEPRTLETRLVTGMVSVKGGLAGRGGDARGVLPTLHGTLELSIVDGHVKKGTVVPKILTILNIPSMLQGQVDLQKEGYPFDTQTATLTIANGRMTSEDIVMNGPILTITAAGAYDFLRDELDMVAAASPFGPYFGLLRNIPLFGTLMDSDEAGVLSALFAIKGSLNAPDVTSMPLESVAMGATRFGTLAFRVLKNTITLPQFFFGNGNASQPTARPADFLEDEDEF